MKTVIIFFTRLSKNDPGRNKPFLAHTILSILNVDMRKHLLLIDHDKNELTAFMAAIKEIQGDFKCTYAESSAQALEMLKYLQPDFIFVDYDLPDVNGLQVLAFIRNEPSLKQAKVFIYTENISEEVGKMARTLGASGCIEKHATVNWLTHMFKAIFDGQLMPNYSILKNPYQAELVQIINPESR
jgi:two-component system chemotaxis response regulator CheY